MKDGANELSNANMKYYHPFSSLSTYVFNGGCKNFWINRLMSHSNTAKKKICSPSVMSLMNLASEFAPGCVFCHEASDFLHSMQEAREAFESCQAFSIFWGFDAEQAAVSTILLGFASCVYCMLRCLGAPWCFPLSFIPEITISSDNGSGFSRKLLWNAPIYVVGRGGLRMQP